MTVTAFVIATLAAFRVTRLIVQDTVFEPARERLTTRLVSTFSHPRRPVARAALFVYDLVQCQWCVGVHVAGWAVAVMAVTGLVSWEWTAAGVVTGFGWWMSLAASQSIVWVAVDALAGDE